MDEKKYKLRCKLILSIVSTTLSVCLMEVTLRITNFNFNIPKYFQFSPDFQIDPLLAEGLLLKDSILFWRLTPNRSRGINSKGMRDKEFSINKPKNTFRVICLGDSVTFGYPEDLNKPEDTYPKRLEVLLNERIGMFNFEVINAGIIGYTSYQGLKYLQTDIIKYHPNLVTIHFGPDDAAKVLYFSDKEQKMQPLWFINLQNFLNKTKVFQFMSKLVFLIKYKFLNFLVLINTESQCKF